MTRKTPCPLCASSDCGRTGSRACLQRKVWNDRPVATADDAAKPLRYFQQGWTGTDRVSVSRVATEHYLVGQVMDAHHTEWRDFAECRGPNADTEAYRAIQAAHPGLPAKGH